MFRTILVPLDGSSLAEASLTFAKEVASRFKAKLVLLQVVPDVGQTAALAMASAGDPAHAAPPDLRAVEQALASEVHAAETYLTSTAEKLKGEGLDVEWEVRRGNAAEQIVVAARQRNADMVAISTHGRSGLGRIIFGSVADQVLRKAGLPILLVKPDNKGEGEQGD